jgi:superfamily II RNA helicase
MLAAIIAAFAYDGNQDVFIPKGKIPRKLTVAYNKILRTVGPVSKRMKDAGFEAGQFNIWPCVAIYRWARGFEWDHITQALKIADGDLAMLVSRTADSLRQIASLKDTHEDIAQLASTGRYAILREPVAFD